MDNRAIYSRRWLIIVAFVVAVITCAGVQCALAATGSAYVPNEYIIRVAQGSTLSEVQLAAAKLGASVKCALPLDDTYVIAMGNRSRSDGRSISQENSARSLRWVIESVQPNFIYQLCASPNDTYWDKMWHMRQINMPTAWDIEKGSTLVTVAVVDSGVANHPELTGRLTPGYDFVDNDPDPNNDLNGHGTHVSGTIAAQGGNSIGVTGVCWDGVQIMPVRSADEAGRLSSESIIQGLDWALTHGANVVNMSFGGDYPDSAEHEKIVELSRAGIILVAAAGNSTADVGYPAAFDECIAVASTGPGEGLAPYSSFGPGNEVDIAAPGGDGYYYGEAGEVWSTIVSWDETKTIPTFGYGGMQGTSMACPHVAGAAALLLSYGIAASEVRSRLINSARPPKTGVMDRIKYGYGILDVRRALAGATLRIVAPIKGGVVTSSPDFIISMQGVAPTSIKVYFDYSDLDDNGIPDNFNEAQIINATNAGQFINADQTAIAFNWSDASLHVPQRGPLASGIHTLYVTGTASVGGASVEDWAAFNVAGRVLLKGIHMLAFPLALNNRLTNTPDKILAGAKFGMSDVPRTTLIRWMAAPRSATDSRQIGYETYVEGSSFDRTWVNPSYIVGGNTLPLAGGGYYDLLTRDRVSVSPAGSGYWLVLPQDVSIDETFTTLENEANFDGSKGFEIQLYNGWNMIGNPYGHSIPWRAALFTYKGQTKSLLDAETAGWIRSTLYGYGGTKSGYVRVTDRDMLEAYGGYWFLAQVGGTSDSQSLVVNLLP